VQEPHVHLASSSVLPTRERRRARDRADRFRLRRRLGGVGRGKQRKRLEREGGLWVGCIYEPSLRRR
jgi:hypothetical protein